MGRPRTQTTHRRPILSRREGSLRRAAAMTRRVAAGARAAVGVRAAQSQDKALNDHEGPVASRQLRWQASLHSDLQRRPHGRHRRGARREDEVG